MIEWFSSRDTAMSFSHWMAGLVGTSGGGALFPSHESHGTLTQLCFVQQAPTCC